MARVRSMKEAGYDPGKYTMAEIESRRRFTDKLTEGVEGISSGISQAVSGLVKEKKADAKQLSQLNEEYSVMSSLLDDINKESGLYKEIGVTNAREAIEQRIGPTPPPDADRDVMAKYVQDLNSGLSAIYHSAETEGKLSSGFYQKTSAALKRLGIDFSAAQKSSREKEFATDVMQKTLPYEAVGPRVSGESATQQAVSQNIDMSQPVVGEAIGGAQISTIPPGSNSEEAIRAIGGTPMGGAKPLVESLPTQYQNRVLDIASEKANKAISDKKKSSTQQAAEKELTKIRQDISQQTDLMKDYEAKLLKAEPEYDRLKDAMASVKKGEAIPGEFVDSGGKPYTDESLRRDLHRAEAEYKAFKKNYDSSYNKIEELSKLDSSVSGRIKKSIDIEMQQKAKRVEDATRLKDSLERIFSATPVGERAQNLTLQDVSDMLKQNKELSDEEVDIFVSSVKESGRSVEEVYKRLLKHLETISQ